MGYMKKRQSIESKILHELALAPGTSREIAYSMRLEIRLTSALICRLVKKGQAAVCGQSWCDDQHRNYRVYSAIN